MGRACIFLSTLFVIASAGALVQGSSSSNHERIVASRWRSAINEITTGSSRLAIFADAIWNNYYNPNTPTHQHLLTSPDQKCDAPFPDLIPSRPFHNPNIFPWTSPLESNWLQVRQELEAYLDAAREDRWKTSSTKLCDDTNGFTKLTIQDHQGNPTDIGLTAFSKTLALLRSIVGPSLAPRPVNINCQAPQTGLAEHSDNMNFLLTCHLGLCIPKEGECIFRVGSQNYQWHEGKVVVADTSFLHETFNTSPNQSRYVLSFCIWHPDLSEEERKGIIAIHSLQQQLP